MTLVERFIEFNSWPTSRKSVLLIVVALPFTAAAYLTAYALIAPTGIADARLFGTILLVGFVTLLLCLALTWLAVRAGGEGRWTAYFFVLVFGAWLAWLIASLGVWATSLIAWVPVAVVLVALWYDERIGLFSAGYAVVLISVGYVLIQSDVLPFAPLILDRRLDAQHSPRWALAMLVWLGLFSTYCFVLSVLVVKARKILDLQLRESQKLIRRYVPAQVADAILSGQGESVTAHARRKLTVFFSDLVGFTDIAEQMEPEDLSRVLNEYFSEMTAIAERYDGTVDELSGDAILILFGAPQAGDDKDQALRAVRMATDMLAVVEKLNAKWRAAGIDVVFKVRMGINTGVATVGNFGSEGRTKYAALGRSVNLAARLQAEAEPGRILICHPTWLLVQDQIPSVPKGELQLKGIARPVMVYEVSREVT